MWNGQGAHDRLVLSRRALIQGALAVGALRPTAFAASGAWTIEQARRWQGNRWLVGCNFVPSTAINQLEMWQTETFDLPTIERELGWAAELGFSSVRVFLHDLLWKQDAVGFVKRLDAFLTVAARHDIGALLVLFDGVWHPRPKLGKQPAPRAHTHNSGWVQSPGAEVLRSPKRQRALVDYVRGVVGHFRSDKRIDGWDLFNEPDNDNRESYPELELPDKEARATQLLRMAFDWARAERPTQPVTAGVWNVSWGAGKSLRPLARLMLDESDVLSFHSYAKPEKLEETISQLERYGRPILCTEFMARPNGSTFDPSLELLERHKIGAYMWGFVAGKTQTNYPWDSWKKAYREAPDVWFHDLLHPDGRPYRPEEVAYIKRVTGVSSRTSTATPKRR